METRMWMKVVQQMACTRVIAVLELTVVTAFKPRGLGKNQSSLDSPTFITLSNTTRL